ncbi:MAG: ABC transporter ATP-binding protein [Caldilineaceae bacterium]|nr:ABC transporter ATP-binding protein [Caldilineaceae bacterium]
MTTTWHYLRALILPRRWFFLRITTSRIIAHLMAVHGVGLLTRAFFDRLTGEGNVTLSIEAIAVLMITIEIARRVIHIWTHLGVVEWNYDTGTLLRRNIFQHVLGVPGAQPLPSSAGDAVSRLRDDTAQIANFTGQSLQRLLSHYVFGITAAMILLRINAQIALLVFLPLVAVLMVANMARKRITHLRRASQQATGNVTGFIGDIFGIVLAIKVAGAETRVADYFRQLNEARRQATLKARLLDETLLAIFYNASSVGVGFILLLAGQAMQAGTFTLGDFSLFVYYLDFVSGMISGTGSTMNSYRQTQVALERLNTLIQDAPTGHLVQPTPVYVKGPLPAVPYIAKQARDRLEQLEIKHLRYHYPNSNSGIEDISLTLPRGSLTVITGRVGAGKTTLLRTILGLLPKQAGEIAWNGEPVLDPARFLVPPRVAYVSQVPHLFSDTLRHNILLGLPEQEVDLVGAIHAAMLDPDLATLSQGLETAVGPKGLKLSGGQVQRTATARALVTAAELLVFDDLSSALDINTELALWQGLLAAPTRTYLVVSHRPHVLQQADQIVLLKQGHAEKVGTLQELLACSEEMRQLWDHAGRAARPNAA